MSLTKVYTFSSDSIGCENVEAIRITTAKADFELSFKKISWLKIN